MRRTIGLFGTVLAIVLASALVAPAADPPAATGETRDTLLYVKTVPPGAKVLLDGKELGTSNDVFPVEPGACTIRIELDGHEPSQKQVTVRANGVTRVELTLKQQKANGGNAPQFSQEGWSLWQKGQMAEAAAKFSQAVQLDPKNENAWNGLGWASFNSGNWPEAQKAFKRAVELNPNHPAALNGLGQLHLLQRKYDLAETYLLKAAPKAPAAWYGLARLYLLQGKFEQAEKYAQMIEDSGQGDDGSRQMLKAAKEKHLSEALRVVIEPQAAVNPAADAESAEAPPLRTWNDSTGAFSVEAEFAGVEQGKLLLKKADGKTVAVPLDRLSQEDRDFVAEQTGARPQPGAKSQELSHDDGKPAGKSSIAGGGHVVRFHVDGDSWSVTSVRLYGSRYGESSPPKEDFNVWICDAQFKPIAAFHFPYGSFTRGNPGWKTFRIRPTHVPREFFVCVGFDPHQTKGVYVSYDGHPGETSMVGVPEQGEPAPFAKGNWLIRCKVEQRAKDAKGT